MDFQLLKDASRLLIEAELAPLQGTRFQPTGFPDLGAATYQLHDKTLMLLVESSQSVANRLETTIWDEASRDVVAPLRGISYVVVKQREEVLTNSLLEAHRLNSYYILEGKDKTFFEQLKRELDILPDTPVDFHKLAKVLAKYDVNSLLHGIFFPKSELAGGRFKFARALSGFIEARNVSVVPSGGVKHDRVNPATDKSKGKGNIPYDDQESNDLVEPSADSSKKGGKGNIPYHRQEYTAEEIKAYFNLDLNQIRGYRLGEAMENLLMAMAIWKIQRFLANGLRLRTSCDLECLQVTVKRPDGFKLPKHQELTAALPSLVKAAASAFASPPVTEVKYEAEKKEGKKKQK